MAKRYLRRARDWHSRAAWLRMIEEVEHRLGGRLFSDETKRRVAVGVPRSLTTNRRPHRPAVPILRAEKVIA